MKKLLFLLFIITGCTSNNNEFRKSLPLAGEWKFRIDSLDIGVDGKWYLDAQGEPVNLPGSMAENGKGNDVTVNTEWTGDIVDKSYFTDKKYARYREPGNIKIPFWLKPEKYYKGAAWYQKEFELPSGWEKKHLVLFLERPHWETTVFLNGKKAGTQNSLAVPHQFDISGLVSGGRNLISIRVDNRMIVPVGVNSHSISDHTQGNWNGIAGEISIRETSDVYISDMQVFPDIQAKKAKVIIEISNRQQSDLNGKISLRAESFNTRNGEKGKKVIRKYKTGSDRTRIVIDYPMGNNPREWSEFSPSLYRLTAELGNKGDLTDKISREFGMREFRVQGTRFAVNGRPVFLRGTTECCVFPLTGYPPTDTTSWKKVIQACKDHGLNHIRFHSYCPPEAAFQVADREGFYFHIECSSWANQGSTVGDGGKLDQFIYDESERIIKEYGDHPSFCMLAYGNEPAGKNMNEYLGKFVSYWKGHDNRRVYTSAAGWPVLPENDYNLLPGPRMQQWGEGLKSIINAHEPHTTIDFRDFTGQFKIPVVSHEIGQWCVYPDFKEIAEYKGIMKPTNFEIFRETLRENNMGDQAEDFLMASGKLQSLCYKAEIEAALRTPGFAGFQLLQLHDFPGQGTALVGILNPFFKQKGYISPEEFRMFCNETVPLARMKKLIWSNTDSVEAEIEIFHFGAEPVRNAIILCNILNDKNDTLFSKSLSLENIPIGNCIPAGEISFVPLMITEPAKLRLEISIKNTAFRNCWDLWVYPEGSKVETGSVMITDKLDGKALGKLRNGGSVLLLAYGKVKEGKGAEVKIGFSSIFWNTAWTRNQAPHTLGILCDPTHPVFRDFPTENHSNWQWWDPVSHSQAMILNDFPASLKPFIQPIDTWFENRRLALAFESNTGGGKLLVCSIDLKSAGKDRLSSHQLFISILNYMNSKAFDPVTSIDASEIRELFR